MHSPWIFSYHSSNLIYCFWPLRRTQCASKQKIILIRIVEGRYRSIIRGCGCDQEGRRLGWETGIKKVGFEVPPEISKRGTVSYLEGERFPKNWGVVTDRI